MESTDTLPITALTRTNPASGARAWSEKEEDSIVMDKEVEVIVGMVVRWEGASNIEHVASLSHHTVFV